MYEGGPFFVGEQVRGVEAEKTYNRQWLIGLIVGPLLLGVLAAVWMLTVADRLPAELASHWNAKNEVDGWMSLVSTVLMAVGMGALGAFIAPLALLFRAQSLLLARVGVGSGVAFGVGLVALSVAVAAGQLDIVDTSKAELSAPVMAVGVGLAFLGGCGAAWLYKPGEVDREQSPEVVAANQAAATAGSAGSAGALAAAQAARGETLQIKVSMGAWSWVLSLSVGTITALSTYFIFPALALLGVVLAAILWIFCHGTVVIGPDGVKVLAGGFVKVMPLQWKEVRAASVEDIKAMDFGGWGYRMTGGSVGFIMGNGPAVVIKSGFHQTFVISMPHAETAGEAAALINAYVLAGTVKN
ncbi:hypothetical protein CVS28_09200 [Arthrobacter glacialis]|nr:hypothetical protein CVS28_09200 [Arthrobacter glacialis]